MLRTGQGNGCWSWGGSSSHVHELLRSGLHPNLPLVRARRLGEPLLRACRGRALAGEDDGNALAAIEHTLHPLPSRGRDRLLLRRPRRRDDVVPLHGGVQDRFGLLLGDGPGRLVVLLLLLLGQRELGEAVPVLQDEIILLGVAEGKRRHLRRGLLSLGERVGRFVPAGLFPPHELRGLRPGTVKKARDLALGMRLLQLADELREPLLRGSDGAHAVGHAGGVGVQRQAHPVGVLGFHVFGGHDGDLLRVLLFRDAADGDLEDALVR
mmetsp:Transcript_2203/g.9543  ORF Transcript_2203/g.9543 Transcript_2203/m.9543 type:complete len:267 (-) Transcript_2203:657-1457(-)